MKKEIVKKKIKLFWEWFINNEALMRAVVNDDFHEQRESLINAIDNQVLDFGMFTWEIEENKENKISFTISPNGNVELLELSKFIIEHAPNLSNWKFNYAKPIKNWDFTFSVFDDYANEHEIDASEWNFVLLPVNDNKVKVIIEANNITNLDYETKLSAGNFVLTNTLGEECKINNVYEVEIVNELENQYKAFGIQIINLQKQF